MRDAPPDAAAAAAGSQRPAPIRDLNSNDVLLGRGIGPSTFEGNVKFRDEIVAPRKEEYLNPSYREKSRIAREVYDVVKSRGGRFLSLVNANDANGRPLRNVVDNGTWQEVGIKKALDKCKQSLREQYSKDTTEETNEMKTSSQDTAVPLETYLGSPHNLPLTHPKRVGPLADSRLLLFQQPNNAGPEFSSRFKEYDEGPSVGTISSTSFDSRTSGSETEDAAIALSSLIVYNRPKFTEEDEKRERAEMTNEERIAALADVSGQSCSLETHQSKRARRDLDAETIRFLTGQIRLELSQIPVHKKQALVEAQKMASAKEFSDGRLEQFLRVEGMSPKVRTALFIRLSFVFDKNILMVDLLQHVNSSQPSGFVGTGNSGRNYLGPDIS